jgi:RNAse (barnase) inhibitor barstar
MTAVLHELISGELPPGRYRLAVPRSIRAIRAELAEAGWTTLVVDGAAMGDRAELFNEFAAGCDFPDWFGRNWDAFADCLGDLSWLPPRPAALLWLRSGAVDPDLMHTASGVIDAAITARIDSGQPALAVILPALASSVSGGGGPTLRPTR